ncbi:MAG: hypothetical protein ABSE77_05420, partial [Acidimicrobiales bacterium]
ILKEREPRYVEIRRRLAAYPSSRQVLTPATVAGGVLLGAAKTSGTATGTSFAGAGTGTSFADRGRGTGGPSAGAAAADVLSGPGWRRPAARRSNGGTGNAGTGNGGIGNGGTATGAGGGNGAPASTDEPAMDVAFESYAGPLRPRAGAPATAPTPDQPDAVVPDLVIPPAPSPRPAGAGDGTGAGGRAAKDQGQAGAGAPAPTGKVPPRPRGAPPRARKKAPRRR